MSTFFAVKGILETQKNVGEKASEVKLVEDADVAEMDRKEKVKSDGDKDNKLDTMKTHSEDHKKEYIFDHLKNLKEKSHCKDKNTQKQQESPLKNQSQ